MNREIDIDEEGEAAALQRTRFPDNLLARNCVRAQVEEIIGADEAHFNVGDRSKKNTEKNSSNTIWFTSRRIKTNDYKYKNFIICVYILCI